MPVRVIPNSSIRNEASTLTAGAEKMARTIPEVSRAVKPIRHPRLPTAGAAGPGRMPRGYMSAEGVAGRMSDAMSEPASIVVRRRVEWADTDASGKYHNTVAFKLAEQAETRLLDALGLLEDVYGRLPRVHMSADLTEPLRFNDEVEVDLRVEEVGKTSLTYGFDIRKGGRSVAVGRMIAVLLRGPGQREEWPAEHRRVLQQAGPQIDDRS